MQLPKIHPPRLEYQNKYQKIYRISADFEKFHKEYFVTYFGRRAALVVARGEDILLVRQYRLLINGVSWEIPGGTANNGETPEQAAIRECREESGLICKTLEPLVYYHLGLDITDNPTYVFVCHDFDYSNSPVFDEKETTKIAWIPLTKCLQMIFEQTILDSMSVLAILAYYTKRSMHIQMDSYNKLIEHHYLDTTSQL